MKIIFSIAIFSLFVFATTSCTKDDVPGNTISDTPATPPPAGLAGSWASGYSSMTELVDAYNGQYVGNAWVSGKFFKITGDGKQAEFYYSGESASLQSATKATGTIAFDMGSTAEEGTFTFYANWGHFNAWGTTRINRDASKDELANQLTAKYYYRVEGDWLRIEPKSPVNDYSSSFEKIN